MSPLGKGHIPCSQLEERTSYLQEVRRGREEAEGKGANAVAVTSAESEPEEERASRAWLIFFLIGWIAIVVGIAYLLVPEPWLMDRRANERLLDMSFEELLQQVPTLPSYLVVIYRFFGLYLLGFGMVTAAVAATAFRRGERWAWWLMFLGLGGLLLLQTYLIAVHIPVSPFLWLDILVLLLWGIGLAFSAKVGLRR